MAPLPSLSVAAASTPCASKACTATVSPVKIAARRGTSGRQTDTQNRHVRLKRIATLSKQLEQSTKVGNASNARDTARTGTSAAASSYVLDTTIMGFAAKCPVASTCLSLLGVGRQPDEFQVGLDFPVLGYSRQVAVVERCRLVRARLVVQQLKREHVHILFPDVLVQHQGWQNRPHNSPAEGAGFDHPKRGSLRHVKGTDLLLGSLDQRTDGFHGKPQCYRRHQLTADTP
mmetsp:Transcript_55209/g.126885  ORF Transcript_55209/g.126885 Transcript_55209/m.126885 type:complete len:231 (+) Transcript_55209:252-944(+)